MKHALALLLLLAAGVAHAVPWDIVQDETRIEVDAEYLGGIVTMRFDTVLGEVDFDARRPERVKASIVVPVAQVETGLGFVNALIRGRDFLNERQFPQISFRVTELVQTSKSTADIYGDMTLLGVTRPMLFRGEVFRYGPAKSDPDKFQAGFTLKGNVDRRSFGHTSGFPQLAAVFPVRIRLLMQSR